MANMQIRDSAKGTSKYIKASGEGTELDPHVLEQTIEGEVDFGRSYTETPLTLVYNGATTPNAYIDVRGKVIVTALIPAAFQNVAFNVQFAKAAAPAAASPGIPRRVSSEAYGAMVSDTVPVGGSWYIFEAEACGAPFFGLVFGSNVTGTIDVWLKS